MGANNVKKIAGLPVANIKKIGGISTQYVKKIKGVAYDAFPLSIAGIKLWLDASKITGLSDGNAVSAWNDESGNGLNTAQSDSAKRPVYKTNIINGLPVVRFDGTNDNLNVSITLPTYITVFIVSGNASAGKTFFIEHGANANNETGFYFFGEGGNATNIYRDGASDNYTASGWFGNSFAVASMTYDGTALVYKNGSAVSLSHTAGTARSNSDVTKSLYIGERYPGDVVPMGADIAELIIYTGKLSDANRQAVENYLKTKYGIA